MVRPPALRGLAAAFAMTLAAPLAALAQTTTVQPLDLGPWQVQNAHCSGGANTGTTGFETGPGTPPLGAGSARLTVGADGDSLNAFRYTRLDGITVDQVTELRYSTYVQVAGSGSQAPYLLLDVDYDGDSVAEDQLFFEPVYQDGTYPGDPVPNQGTVTVGTWQQWDAVAGGWWSRNAGNGPPLVTLANYFAAHPTARVVNDAGGQGGLRVAAGCNGAGWSNFVGNFDQLILEVFDSFKPPSGTFDFEPTPAVTIADLAQPEGDVGITNFDFTLTLSHVVSQTVTVDYAVTPGTALAGSDYVAASGTVVFGPFETTATIAVQVNGDPAFEPDETFFVDLSAPQFATLGDNQAQGTIQNDDQAPGTADLSIVKTGPASVAAGANVTYTIAVGNAGPQAASNVVVTDTIPAGTTFVSATPTQGSCSGTTTVTCALGAIGVNGSATVTLVVQAPSGSMILVNTAEVANTPEADPLPDDNASTASTQVLGGSTVADVPSASGWGLALLIVALAGLALRRLS